jgi:hypothetical protein
MPQPDRKKRIGAIDTRQADDTDRRRTNGIASGVPSQTTPQSSRERRGEPGQGDRKQPEKR